MKRNRAKRYRHLGCERLESRRVLSTLLSGEEVIGVVSGGDNDSHQIHVANGSEVWVAAGKIDPYATSTALEMRVFDQAGSLITWGEGRGVKRTIKPDFTGLLSIQLCLADAYAAPCNSNSSSMLSYRLRVFVSNQQDQLIDGRDTSSESGEESTLQAPFSSFSIIRFNAQVGQHIRLHAGGDWPWNQSPFPDLSIALFDPNGIRFEMGRSGFSSQDGDNKATLRATATTEGTHVAIISESLISSEMTFRIRTFVSGVSPVLLDDRDDDLENGEIESNALPQGGLNIYTFDAHEDASIRFAMADTTVNAPPTRPSIIVFAPNGSIQQLDDVYGSSSFPVLEFVAAQTGSYTVLVSERSGFTYARPFAYELRLFVSSRPLVNLGGRDFRMSSGEERLATVKAGTPTFVLMDIRNEGEVRIAASNSDAQGNAPRLELFGPNGSLVSDSEPQGSVASVIELPTTEVGQYVLLVYDSNNNDDLQFSIRMFNGGDDQVLIESRDFRLLPSVVVNSSVGRGMFNLHEFLALPDDEISLSVDRRVGSDDDPVFSVSSPSGDSVPVSREGSDWTFTSDQFGVFTVVMFAERLRSGETVDYSIELNGTLGDIIYDFGDAPQPYPVDGNDGVFHVGHGPKLGEVRDREIQGMNHPSALGDDIENEDDEDGVVFESYTVGQHDATLQLTASEGARVDGWIDFNGDGNWGGLGEQILDSALVVAGTNVISFDVPEWTKSGHTYARFRISSAGDLGQKGQAADGEVEDYRLEILPPIASNALFEPGRLIDTFEAADVALEAGDLDGDGDSDLIYADDGIYWVENQISGFSNRRLIASFADSGNVWQLKTEDLDGDGDKDIVSTSWEENRLVWYENRGSESFISNSIEIDQDGVIGVAVADMEGDGDYDLVVGSWRDGKITVFANDGAGGFTASRVMSQPGGSSSVQVFDVDYDGDLDIVSGSSNGDRIDWFENDGMMQFTRRLVADAVDGTQKIWVADINGDGDADVLSANLNLSGGSITLHRNDGDENFTQVILSDSTSNARHVTVGDLDGDGDFDLIASYGDEFAWLRLASNGDFTKVVLDDDAQFAREAIPVDIDLDGDLDVVGISAGDNDLRWYRNVNSFNDPPTGITLLPSAVEENSSLGTIVGELTASDPNPGDTITFSFVFGEGDEDNRLFQIDGSQLRVNASLDHEESETRSIRLRATDQGGLWTEASFVVQVVDINESPTDITISNASIAENLIPDTFIGTFSTEDQDENDFFAYELVDGEGSNNNNLFAIVGGDLRSNAVFDFETQSQYSIRVRSTDSGSESEERFFTILIVNRNDSPTGIELSNASIDENLPPGTEIGMLTAIDQDADDEFEFQLPDGEGDNDAFQIIDNSLQTNQAFDFEHRSQYRAVVTVRDREGARETVTLEIAVLDVNEPSNSISLSSNLIPENAATATLVGQFSTDDPEQDDQFAYELVSGEGSDDNAAFSIEGNELRSAVEFDFETLADHTIRVRSTDFAGNVLEQIFTVMVTDQNDAPTGLALSQSSVGENEPIGSFVGELSATDPDREDDLTFELINGSVAQDNDRFIISGSALLTNESFDYETQAIYSIRISAIDSGGLSIEKIFQIEIQDVDDSVPEDVNGDGIVRPLDALIIINYLNRSIDPTVTDETRSLDVNRNGLITPIDALIIINYLNRQPRGEGEAPLQRNLNTLPIKPISELGTNPRQVGLIFANLDDSDGEFDL